ncbi:unannotated protein [freshwater metagenome]|uniref:Unannotated protein n=1 Tax=freshwater metagenome TaxID=449393 RepID=A0A6J6YY93_9ZZZZ
MIATRSPIFTLDAIKPLATERISSSNSLAVTGCQPSPSGREATMRSGSNQARSEIKLVRFPAAAGGIIDGMVISFICPTLVPHRRVRLDLPAIIRPTRR